MDGIKYVVFTDKSIRLLVKNQCTSNVESRSARTEMKYWVKLFFGAEAKAMNSHQLPGRGRRMEPIVGHTMRFKCKIITLQPDYSILSPRKKRTMLIHLYKTFTPSTHNGAVDSQSEIQYTKLFDLWPS